MISKTAPRVAVIGCGTLAEIHLVPALQRIGWTPRVLIDPAPQRIEAVSRLLTGGSRLVTGADWRHLAGAFDAAIVAVPPALHSSIGTALADAGKDIFLEKPLAVTPGECQDLIDAAERNQVILSVGLLRRYLRIARWTKALIESGVLGEITRFDAREGWVFGYNPSSDGILRRDLGGGGVFMDIGTHHLDLLQWWFGDLIPIEYRDDNLGGVESDCVLDCRLASGATGRVELSRTRNLRDTVRIQGTKGFIEVHVAANAVIAGSLNALAFRHDGVTAFDMAEQTFPELFDAELRDFRASVSDRKHRGVTGREGAQSIELIEECYAMRQPLKQPWITPSASYPRGSDLPFSRIPKNSKVLITGATGFIGGRLAERLVLERAAEVRCLVRSYGRAVRLARLPVEIMLGDLCNPDDVERAVEGVDYVFHCAYDPKSRRHNVEGFANITAACAAHHVRRLVHVSTFSVYEPFPDGTLTEETRDGDRTIDYVDTKLELERMALEAAHDRGLPVTVVQPAIVYGPFSTYWTDEPAHMLLHSEPVLPQGGGLCNPVYIDDLVDGLVLAAISPAAVGERIILSGPRPIPWTKFFDYFAWALEVPPPHLWPRERIEKASATEPAQTTGADSRIRSIARRMLPLSLFRNALRSIYRALPPAVRFALRKRDAAPEFQIPAPRTLALYGARAVVDIAKARRILGYEPTVEFEDGFALTAWYLKWAYNDARRSLVRRTYHGQSSHPSICTRMPPDWFNSENFPDSPAIHADIHAVNSAPAGETIASVPHLSGTLHEPQL